MILFLTVFTVSVFAGCLNWVAGIAMSEVQRATAGASTSKAQAARSGAGQVVEEVPAQVEEVNIPICVVARRKYNFVSC